MLKVITISDSGGGISIEDFTIDTTQVSSDSTIYTADQTVIYMDGSLKVLEVPYRSFDSNVILYIYDKMLNDELYLELTARDLGKGMMRVIFEYDFKDGQTYEATIRSTNQKLLWRGRIFVTKQTDLQNFDINFSENNIIKI